MAEDQTQSLDGPDLKTGVEFSRLVEDQPLLGHYQGEAVVVVRKGGELFATGATCTHYSGPLAEGLVVDETIRCPWHHARFSLRTGEAEGAPALNPLPCFDVRREGGLVRITGKKTPDFRAACPLNPSSVLIVGGGAAGAACAEMLRTKGYNGPITIAGDEDPGPVDRPNLSKDYLAGSAPEEWIALRSPEYYQERRIELLPDDPAVRIRPAEHRAWLRSGRTLDYGMMLLATGAEPRSIPIKGVDQEHVFRLRTLADSKAIIARSQQARTCVVIGSSFIGLEAAASLRARGLEVTVISQDSVPLERVMGTEVGRFVQKLHEEHGVRFLLNAMPAAIHEDRVDLTGGGGVPAQMVILGVGVSPRTSLAEEAGIQVGDGIVVNETLLTSAPGVFAAGDVARFPEHVSGEEARIEHWVVAERQGQGVARRMLGIGGPFRQTPFFWSQHYDVTISYVGHASKWDRCEVKGDLERRDACVVYRLQGRILAAATIGRDLLSLQLENAMESGDVAGLESLLR